MATVAPPQLPQMPREKLPKGEVLCEYCSAKCCQYFALEIDAPKSKADFDYIRWYMVHGQVSVFVEDGVWFLMVHNRCNHLLENNLCGIYETRPQICRDYSTDNCEYDDDACYEKLFETPDQLWEYAEAVLPMSKPKKRKRTQLPLVTVAN
jgi:Fe-S-cluster containining protein